MTDTAEKDAWRKGYVIGFRHGGKAVARSVDAVLDGYDFAGNALAQAVCEGYRDMIRSRLAAALAVEADTSVIPPAVTEETP